MLLLKIACVYLPLAVGIVAILGGFLIGNSAWVVIGGLIVAFTALPAKYDPAIQLKVRNERKAGRWVD